MKFILKNILLLFYFFLLGPPLKADSVILRSGYCFAQSDTLKQNKKTVEQIDGIDVIKKICRIKNSDKKDSVLAKPHKLYTVVYPGFGYSILTSFTAAVTANFAFYTGDVKTVNLSAITLDCEYSLNHQFIPNVVSSIWTDKNKFNFLGEYRYYNYSTYTYGLGGNSPTEDPDYYTYSLLRIYQLALKQIAPDLLVGFGYNLDHHWHIKDTDPLPDSANDVNKYGFAQTTTSSGVSLNLLYDTRRNLQNPVGGGSFVNVILKQNLTQLGSDQNWNSLYIDLRKYISFPKNSKNTLCFWQYDWLTLKGDPPYFDLPSTGWDMYTTSGRPYIQGRYRGKNLLYFETEYRFTITRNGLFGGAVFANAESTSEWPTNNFKTIVPGIGASFRIKANKHSNTNFMVSYGIGADHQQGFSINLGEIF